jgi:hypothetical protein
MIKFNLGALGEHTPAPPASMATAFELVTAWSDDPSRTELGYLCAAAICLSIQAPNKPRYKIPIKIQDYGRDCVEFLLNAQVTIPLVYSYGSYILGKMVEQLPTSEGAEDAADFLSQLAGAN